MLSSLSGFTIAGSSHAYSKIQALDSEKEVDGSNCSSSTYTPSCQQSEEARNRSSSILCSLLIPLAAIVITVLISFVSFTGPDHQDPQVISRPEPHFPHIKDPAVLSRLQSPIKWDPHTPSPCGHTRKSALSAGCVFGPTTWAWYPAACYDWALEAEFLRAGDWAWYANESLNSSARLLKEEVVAGKHDVAYMDLQYHKMHCTFARKKLLRALIGISGALTDNYVLGLAHGMHCDEVEENRENLTFVKGAAKYLDCVQIVGS